MDRLDPEQRAEFVRAASAALATKERMELLRERAAASGGAMALDPGRSRSVAAPDEDLTAALLSILRAHPEVGAVRSRGHVFTLLMFQGGHVLGVVPESAIADVEGRVPAPGGGRRAGCAGHPSRRRAGRGLG